MTSVEDTYFQDLVATMTKPSEDRLQEEKILSLKVDKVARNKTYMNHLVKWTSNLYSEATWVIEVDFKKHGIDPSLIPSKS